MGGGIVGCFFFFFWGGCFLGYIKEFGLGRKRFLV